MARPLTWRSLTTGLIVTAVVAGTAFAMLWFGRIGALRGSKAHIYMVTNAASGVIEGTEVWLGGQKVGLVEGVRMRPIDTDTAERVLIAMEVLAEHLPHIRRDSDVQLRPGTSLIGAPVVYITMGSANAERVLSGDTLRAREQIASRTPRAADFAAIGDSVVEIGNQFRQLSAQAKEVNVEIQQLRHRTDAQVAAVSHAIDQFAHRGRYSDGTIAKLGRDPALRQRIASVSAQADSITNLLNSPTTSLGRFRRDSSIFSHIDSIQTTIDTLRTRFSMQSTLERADSAAAHALMRTTQQLDSLTADMKRNPLKYLSF